MQQEEETPRERFLASQEILSTVEWADDLQDKRACAEAMALFEMHTAILLAGAINFFKLSMRTKIAEAFYLGAFSRLRTHLPNPVSVSMLYII